MSVIVSDGIVVSGVGAPFNGIAWPSGQFNSNQPGSQLCAFLSSVNATFGFNLTNHSFNTEWVPCGEIDILAQGVFAWKQTDVWHADRRTEEMVGKLPDVLFAQILHDLRNHDEWVPVDGIPTYRIAIDDTMSPHPESITELRRFLRKTEK